MSTVDKIQFTLLHLMPFLYGGLMILDCLVFYWEWHDLSTFMFIWIFSGAVVLFSSFLIYSNWKYVHDGMKVEDHE